MGACYQALGTLASRQGEMQHLLNTVLTQRDINPKHFANLFFRGVQQIELFDRRNASYPHSLTDPVSWEKELLDILKVDGDQLQEVLLTRDTTTTIYQRYAGAGAILSALL